MKNKKVLIILITLAFTFLFMQFTYVFADFGNYNSYDTRNDTRYYYNSYDNDDSGISIFEIANSIDFIANNPELFKVLGIVIICLFVFIVLVFFIGKKILKNRGIDGYVQQYDANDSKEAYSVFDLPLNNKAVKNIVIKIRTYDKGFELDDFEKYVGNIFVALQKAWTNRNLKPVRHYQTMEMYEQSKIQIEEYINQNKINVIKDIVVNYVQLRDYKIDGDYEIVDLELSAKMNDYIIDSNTKKIIEGDEEQYYRMRYTMRFIRKFGNTTNLGENENKIFICPNCGSEVTTTSAGICEFCGTIVITNDHGWQLSAIKLIKQTKI